jgi:hypothetical protein
MYIRRGNVARSRRNPTAALSDAGHSAIVLVAFAMIALRPIHSSVGKEISVPPPAIELMMPARNAAPAMTHRSIAAPRPRTNR